VSESKQYRGVGWADASQVICVHVNVLCHSVLNLV